MDLHKSTEPQNYNRMLKKAIIGEKTLQKVKLQAKESPMMHSLGVRGVNSIGHRGLEPRGSAKKASWVEPLLLPSVLDHKLHPRSQLQPKVSPVHHSRLSDGKE